MGKSLDALSFFLLFGHRESVTAKSKEALNYICVIYLDTVTVVCYCRSEDSELEAVNHSGDMPRQHEPATSGQLRAVL